MNNTADESAQGIVNIASEHSGEVALARLLSLLHEKGLTQFACIDFSGDARAAGLSMPFSRLVIFGNPTAGTPLMQHSPTAALDLPLKILIREDAQGQTWLSFNSADYLRDRHGLPDTLIMPLRGVAALADAVAR